MENENTVVETKTRKRRVGRAFFVGVVALLALYCVGRLLWRFSGSNEWELVREGKGAKVYTLKEPGTDLKQVRGVIRVHTTLNRAVAWLQDLETCKDAGCKEPKMLEQVDEEIQYVSMRYNMPSVFRPREFVLRVHFHQIPKTKEIWVEYAAVPEKIPANDCCFRVSDMNNTWRLTPVENGQVEIEYTMNMDWGGYLPDVMSNGIRPRYMFRQLQKLDGYMNKDKYRNVRYAFIQEPNNEAVAAESATPAGGAGQGSSQFP